MPRKVDFTPYNKTLWTPEMDQYLRDNFEGKTNAELAKELNLRLTTTRTRLYELGLKRMELEYWTEEQVTFLIQNYEQMGDVELAEVFNQLWKKGKGWSKKHIEKKRRYLKLKRTDEQKKLIKARNTAQGRFEVCAIKRWQKTGQAPIGHIVEWRNYETRVLMIKTASGYMRLDHFVWIQNYGPIPAGKMIGHKNNDYSDCSIENLILRTRQEHAENNRWTDKAIASKILGYRSPDDDPEERKKLKEMILQVPQLIDVKRTQLQLQKTIKDAQG